MVLETEFSLVIERFTNNCCENFLSIEWCKLIFVINQHQSLTSSLTQSDHQMGCMKLLVHFIMENTLLTVIIESGRMVEIAMVEFPQADSHEEA